MKHRHYSPSADILLVSNTGVFSSGSGRNAYIGLKSVSGGCEIQKICDSAEDYAHSVFDFFRECDRQGIERIYCERVEETGIGSALMDRIKRAAEN
ncbi:MAG: threonylcarbamoyl-AMP synthase, partial [Acidobacteria bacterium]|nr:threonylcarbamoyl-AMP synthase [Acidobacteriota bacterium]